MDEMSEVVLADHTDLFDKGRMDSSEDSSALSWSESNSAILATCNGWRESKETTAGKLLGGTDSDSKELFGIKVVWWQIHILQAVGVHSDGTEMVIPQNEIRRISLSRVKREPKVVLAIAKAVL